ncbi:MAG: FecR domain-containing protein [Bacteroidota bacterium]
MENIYQILAKYFQGKTSPEENILVDEFKNKHLKEYNSLEQLWNAKLAEVKDFDHEQAWRIIQKKAIGKKTKTISLYRRIASVAAVLLILASASIYLFSDINEPEMITVMNNSESTMHIELPDKSIAILNKDASIQYPEKFENKLRNVSMAGEVFYDVEKDNSRPFIIKTLHADVKVLGTSFNIDSNSEETSVSVTTGTVQVNSLSTDESVTLTPGEKALITASSLIESKENDDNYISWKTGVFTFEEESVSDVIASLSEYYNNKISLSTTNDNCSISTTFDNMELKYVVEIISVTCNLKIRETNNVYELY